MHLASAKLMFKKGKDMPENPAFQLLIQHITKCRMDLASSKESLKEVHMKIAALGQAVETLNLDLDNIQVVEEEEEKIEVKKLVSLGEEAIKDGSVEDITLIEEKILSVLEKMKT